jgi:hypothetical protein
MKDDRAAEPVQTQPSKDDPVIPSLNKETWEYIELRLWNSFSKKLWVLITSMLTVAGLLALLGLNGWIKYQVDQTLSDQKVKFELARKTYESQAEDQLLAAGLIIALSERYIRDREKYVNHVNAIQTKLSSEQKSKLESFAAVLTVLTRYPEQLPKKSDFDQQLSAFKSDARIQDEYRGQGRVINVIDNTKDVASEAAHMQALSATLLMLKRCLRAYQPISPSWRAHSITRSTRFTPSK